MRVLGTAVLLLLAVPRAASADDGEVASRTEALVTEDVACSNPEVGYLETDLLLANGSVVFGGNSPCTATLIAPDVVLTASHCVSHVSCEPEPAGSCTRASCLLSRCTRATVPNIGYQLRGTFVVNRHRVGIRAVRSFGEEWSIDVAIVQLAAPVPASVATPAPIADAPPAYATPVWQIGFGCTDRVRPPRTTAGARRIVAMQMGRPSTLLCYGDSGGPTLDAQGRVIRVATAIFAWSSIPGRMPTAEEMRVASDGFADLHSGSPTMLQRIDEQLGRWGIVRPRGGGSPPVPPTMCDPSAGERSCDLMNTQFPRCTTVLGNDLCPGAIGLTADGCTAQGSTRTARRCFCASDGTWDCQRHSTACMPIAGGGEPSRGMGGGGCAVSEHASQSLPTFALISIALIGLQLRTRRRS